MEEMARFFSGSVPLSGHTFPALAPQLVILSHKTHCEETVSKNGLQKSIHVVVKNSPFYFTIGVTNATQKVDFNQIAFESFLVYDCEGEKEVDFVKVKPLEFKPSPSENGQQLEVELRIKVLTSQHEDMLFKVRIKGFNPLTREEIHGICLTTPPIKVISKPEQLKKKQPNKKRTLTDMLVETISRIEKKQEEQQKLIEKMMTQQVSSLSVLPAAPSVSPAAPVSQEKRQRVDESLSFWDDGAQPVDDSAASDNTSASGQEAEKEKEAQAPEFEEAFGNLVRAYNALKAEEKAETIRKIIRNTSIRDTEKLSELLDLFWTEGLQKEPSFGRARDRMNPALKDSNGCSCFECPHKTELERIDEFYREFLSTSVPQF